MQTGLTKSLAPLARPMARPRAWRANGLTLLALAVAAALASPAVRAQDAGGKATNEANNPLTAKASLNLQDYYTPSFYGPLNSAANAFSCAA